MLLPTGRIFVLALMANALNPYALLAFVVVAIIGACTILIAVLTSRSKPSFSLDSWGFRVRWGKASELHNDQQNPMPRQPLRGLSQTGPPNERNSMDQS